MRAAGRMIRRQAGAAAAGLALVVLCACIAGEPAASVSRASTSPSIVSTPSPGALSGAITITGAVQVRFPYAAPLKCIVRGSWIYLTFNGGASGQLSFDIPLNASPGTLTVSPGAAGAPTVVYQASTGFFNDRSGTITVTGAAGGLYTGAIDVTISSLAAKTAHVSGTWACRLP